MRICGKTAFTNNGLYRGGRHFHQVHGLVETKLIDIGNRRHIIFGFKLINNMILTHIVNIAMMLEKRSVSCDLLEEEYTDMAERFRETLRRYNGTARGNVYRR